ncbi:hypothetical protein GCM10023194_28210 [Planotetraspora phitsanulokensis]|uniref:Uncharacterized protein n=1 Tax=Planotetraspora phitsanulokensis TaxID=575192 RepID=A0A8J3U325_9ACTN|nr:hypothetical protein [Planotetraspora phitsanulokensis]GII36042.1 hypothetical protein Pph01_10450 [Planotetraspora phitsanulokensis]
MVVDQRQVLRYLASIQLHDEGRDLEDLELLRCITDWVNGLEDDLRLAQQLQALWISQLQQSRRYSSALLAQVIDSPSGPSAGTRIKLRYAELLRQWITREQCPDSKELLHDALIVARRDADDPSLPEWLRRDNHIRVKWIERIKYALFGEICPE